VHAPWHAMLPAGALPGSGSGPGVGVRTYVSIYSRPLAACRRPSDELKTEKVIKTSSLAPCGTCGACEHMRTTGGCRGMRHSSAASVALGSSKKSGSLVAFLETFPCLIYRCLRPSPGGERLSPRKETTIEMRHAYGPCVYSCLNKISNLMARDIKMARSGDMRKTAHLAAHDHISL
jgi:hypothetical protein